MSLGTCPLHVHTHRHTKHILHRDPFPHTNTNTDTQIRREYATHVCMHTPTGKYVTGMCMCKDAHEKHQEIYPVIQTHTHFCTRNTTQAHTHTPQGAHRTPELGHMCAHTVRTLGLPRLPARAELHASGQGHLPNTHGRGRTDGKFRGNAPGSSQASCTMQPARGPCHLHMGTRAGTL